MAVAGGGWKCVISPLLCALSGEGNEGGLPADGQPVVPVSQNAWVGPNQFGCSVEYIDGDRVHKRTSSGHTQVGIKVRFSCPQNPGKMALHIEIERKKGWVWTENMGSTDRTIDAPASTIAVRDFSTRCAGGTHRYNALIVAEVLATDGRYSRGVIRSPLVTIEC